MAVPASGHEPQVPPPTAAALEEARHRAREHADDPATGVCRHCGVSRCEVWREADVVILGLLCRMAPTDSEDAK
jgi:hypothetical protein